MWLTGRFTVTNRYRHWPVFIAPTFNDPKHRWRTAGGVSVNFGKFGFYLIRERP